MSDLSQTRHVQPDDPLSSDLLSQPTRSLEYRLALLEEEARHRAAAVFSNRVIIPNVLLDNLTQLNDVVFFNQATDRYEAALAGAVFNAGTFQGTAPSVAVGVVVRKSGIRGDILVGGYDSWPGNDPLTMLESGLAFKAGVPYYLSAAEAGKVTHVPPAYRVQVLVATDLHFVMAPAYSTLESFQDSFPVAIGMRPVGSLRSLPPLHQQAIVVGFDGLEKDAGNGLWSSTRQGVHADYGWLVADANITNKPSAPFFIQVKVTTGGVVTVKHAVSLEAASSEAWYATTQQAPGVLGSGTYTTVREAVLKDPQDSVVGTFRYRFTSGDIAKERVVMLQVPQSFQGWKMVNPAVRPKATVRTAAGVITHVDISEPGVGLLTPPTVTAPGGTGASLRCTLNDVGGVASIEIVAGGNGYTDGVALSFDSRLVGAKILNGGSGATFAITLTSGGVSSVDVTSGGSAYWVPPVLEVVDATGAGTGARLRAVVEAGAIVAVEVLAAGSGYAGGGNTVARVLPSYYGYHAGDVLLRAVNCGEHPPTLSAHPTSGMRLAGVRVDCGGCNYASDLAITVDTGFGESSRATVKPVVGANGSVERVIVISPGANYTSTPTFSVSGSAGTRHGLKLTALMESDISSVTIDNSGSGLTRLPEFEVGVPLRSVSLDAGGRGYSPTLPSSDATVPVTLDASDFGSTNATVAAYKGGKIVSVTVVPGAGYTDPASVTHSFSIPRFYGLGNATPNTTAEGSTKLIQLQPLFVDGQLQEVRVLRAGRSLRPLVKHAQVPVVGSGSSSTFTLTGHGLLVGQRVQFFGTSAGGVSVNHIYVVASVPTANTFTLQEPDATPLTLSDDVALLLSSWETYPITFSGAGTGASAEILVGAVDEVVELILGEKGTGYSRPPKIVIAAPSGGEAAQAHAALQGNGLLIEPTVSGLGLSANTDTLQVKSWHDDFDSNSNVCVKPEGCGFYYNSKADPDFRLRWPSVPLERSLFIAGGVELRVAAVNSTTGTLDSQADVGLLTPTLAWRGLPRLGAPWDPSWQLLTNDANNDGTDAIFRPSDVEDQGWRWWEFLIRQVGQLGTGTVHVNKSSHVAQSGRVQSLTALSPLKLVDNLVGLDNGARPGPMTGQLTIMLDTEENLLSPWSQQLDTTQGGRRIAIYRNTTGRPVFIKSLQVRSTFQVNLENQAATAASAAKITAGTAGGAYRDIVGVPSAAQNTTPGKSLCLFASGQIKEIFPDSDNAAPVLPPGEVVYLVVDAPAGDPIVTQLVTVRVMGHAL